MTDRTIPGVSSSRGWRKSSYSSPNADNCLEVRDGQPGGVPVRDSKNPDGPVLRFSASAWGAFLGLAKGSA
ncbi:DUF397 domain-containing protein [Streptomyces sp. 3MP-14]|uniref:DUF397 domain-containing protein n=1 Tax=Streptomyces mimosae TaxID=2586635 RepID=A0A5N6A3V0_9ACTN|nr:MULTISPECIES: DUF397 domain-containing protein [Streptomyces]KAB8163454.1 DUF397 domain-containing protein [Streptomyces mimosae]KAB8174731.1 DUF397 domain-containing protein [Streptomyces sp. 3MP-14]